jgi:flagellar motor switch protein FliN/FliY
MMAEVANSPDEMEQERSNEDLTNHAEISPVLAQADDLVEELEEERIEWTEDAMPKFETPPSVETQQAQGGSDQGSEGEEPVDQTSTDGAHAADSGSRPGDQSPDDAAGDDQKGAYSAAMSSEKPASSQGDEARRVEEVKTVKFPQFAPSPKGEALGNLDLLLDVKMPLVVELGRSRMLIRDILELGPGSVIELDKAAGEPVDLLVNGKLIARGEVVVIDENFGLRITELADSAQGVSK